ncbi:gamma-glutamylcyclotransferase [Roseococcus sp. DSY-14]|uniref:gamma-glutamylcyclotransferase family protein n=1 Tax=Roseococcus sp. DSY-14 TaxID=3369650 RepID=UPI00387ADCE2
MTVLVFIYGTLKRGFPLHAEGLAGVPVLGPASTAEPHPLVLATDELKPMMFPEPGAGQPVEGELYEVEEARLSLLDRLESMGKPGHLKGVLRVDTPSGPREAWCYVKSRGLAVPVRSPFLARYDEAAIAQARGAS